VNDAFSLWNSTFLSEFASSQEDDGNTEHQQNLSNVYNEIKPVIIVKNKDHNYWQEH
jgi:hypothetical protein